MRLQIKIVLLICFCIPKILQSSEWRIWITPETSVFQKNKDYRLFIGITGYGELSPSNVKMVVHSTPDVLLRGETVPQFYDTIILPFKDDAPKDLFTKPNVELNSFGVHNKIFLETDIIPKFQTLTVRPKSAGNKYIDFYLTYSLDEKHWQTTENRFTFHVNTWYENYEIAIVILTVLFGLSTLMTNLYILIKPIIAIRKKTIAKQGQKEIRKKSYRKKRKR